MQTPPLTDQIANVSPLVIVLIVMGFTLLRIALAKADQSWARAVSETCDTINFVLILAFLLVRPFVAQAFYIPSESMENTLLTGDRLIVDKFSYRLHEPRRGDVVVFQAPPAALNPGDSPNTDFIKRLIGLPGDTIEVRGARLKIGPEEWGPDPYNSDGVHGQLRTQLRLSEDEEVRLFPDHVLVDGTRRLSGEELAAELGRAGEPVTITPGQTLINGRPLKEPYVREDPSYDDGPRRIGEGEFLMLGDNRNRSKDGHIWGALRRKNVVGRAAFVFWPPARLGSIR